MKLSEIKEIIKEETDKSNRLNSLTNSIIQNIEEFESSLSYRDLSKVVANILKSEYGTHNYEPFIRELRSNLSLLEK
jgi:DNA-binding MurR/RpiR family transcriptional regulator